jgi:cyclic-di-AMP phosphodiesterase PgpH
MMFGVKKQRRRRVEIRRNRPETGFCWEEFRAEGGLASIGIAIAFCALVIAILMLREDVVPYRPGQAISHDIVSRVDFVFHDRDLLAEARQRAKLSQPRIYDARGDVWGDLEQRLLALPDRVGRATTVDEIDPTLREQLQIDGGALTRLQRYQAAAERASYDEGVRQYVQAIRELGLIILPEQQRQEDLQENRGGSVDLASHGVIPTESTYSTLPSEELREILHRLVRESFLVELQPKILNYTLNTLQPTHEVNHLVTAERRNRAEQAVPREAGDRYLPANMPIVTRGEITDKHWYMLRAEHEAFVASLGGSVWKSRLGAAGIAVIVTLMLSLYIGYYQPRIVENHSRAIALAALLIAMLLLPQLAAIGSSTLYVFGIAPTILVAMIIAIAYDQRFAIGVSTVHALLVTIALGQGIGFFFVIWAGALTTCHLLDDVRTRSKLIEVGGATALVMMAATLVAGSISLDPFQTIARNSLYTGAAGLAVGFVVLGILPFIEKTFRMTTSMTLLELADASHPLLRRLALEAPGTYNHSLQVATLAEAAAECTGANSLLCRVASYYHDIGKINKSEYFVENQMNGQNRHINLSPSVSLLIIIGHVKDGVEMAKEYNLPTNIIPFIQQHHGTTLVEYFYHQACTQKDARQPDRPNVSETQYRYPGPKPRTKETAVVMMADAAESATRAMSDPTASRIENLVHDLAMKRLLDGQFDECELTLRELELIERSLVKTLLGIYHGRIAYPSQAPAPAAGEVPATAPAAITARTA